MSDRKIIHIDMDAFYASIEQRDFPELRGRPVAVGYAGKRGVVAAASYEARRYGVRSAMPSATALRLCPHLIFVPARFDVYRDVSSQIMDIFRDFTHLVEPLSLDEAYLDVTRNNKDLPSGTLLARQIKNEINKVTGLTASAGVSYNKFLAKTASDEKKPDGLFVVTPKEAERYIASLPIERFYGVGRVTAAKMHRLGIRYGKDLQRMSQAELVFHFGKAGRAYFMFAQGVDQREVKSERIRKSLGAENTFENDLSTTEELLSELGPILETVWERCSRKEFAGRTITLKVKYADFRQITRSLTLDSAVSDFELLRTVTTQLLAEAGTAECGVRLLGVTLSNTSVPQLARQLDIEFPSG